MTELEIDKSHLPRVQDVCHVFAVLEDGALAHNLQEQEIEQYYTTNIQKNQLVQKDIRIAKRLQEEEEEQRGEHRALLSQASRQLEEQDSEYAQMIQQEIQRCAEEEARRREHEDQEMAKRIQEEEERASQMSSGQETNSAGPLLQTEDGACLDLAELEQVLKDEELARRLQEEEDRLLRTSPPAHPRSTLRVSVPDGDFRLAQVAQDEEIAHFIQKQEIKSKHQSHDLDRPDSWREQHDLADPHERRNARERQRERLDSEGLQSPTDDQSPSPTTLPQQSIRNIVEDLDPTFKARRQVKDSLRVGPTISGLSSCQSLPTPDSVLHVSMEEPTFVPPTKRQTEKSGHTKSKEKRENCKHQ